MLKVAFSPIYKYQIPEGHRFPMEKYDLLPEQLIYEGTLKEENLFAPKMLEEKDILKVHLPDYWEKLKNQNISRKEERKIGFPMRSDLVHRGRFIAHGTYECGLYAIQNGAACNIAGGTHHAYPDRGEGFCVFNDIAIATKMLLEQAIVNKVLIVDLDVHQGNGNAFIFQNDHRVFTFSMHGAKNYPLRKEQSDWDIGLADKTDGKYYLKTLKNALPKLIQEVEPDIIFYQSGVDVLEVDKLGRLALTLEDCKERDRFVWQQAKTNEIPIVAVMGGGYAPQLAKIIEAHANTYRTAQEIFF